MSPDYGLGRLPAVDPRDREHTMTRLLARRAPLKPWRYWVPGAVLDQGSEPQCVGFAWRQWLATSPVRTKDGPPAVVIYEAAQLVDEWPGEGYAGTSVRAGAKVMQAAGRLAEYVWAESAADAALWVLGRGPVVLGTDWTERMFDPEPGKTIDTGGAVVGGHAYLAIGYSKDRAAFRCMNSWGSDWGERGRFWLDVEDLQWLMGLGGEACAAAEVAS